MNPYRGADFFSFFKIFFSRLFLDGLQSDELQIWVIGGVAVVSALIGTFLVLRRQTMLANSLSHTILLGIVIAFVASGTGMGQLNIGLMLGAAVVTGLVTAFLTELFSGELNADASNGLVFSALFALGIILVTLFAKNSHVSAEVVMGNADALHISDLKLVGLALGINLLVIGFFYRAYKVATFDLQLARSLGIPVALLNYLLMAQASMSVVAGFRSVGVVMVLALIVGPPLAARNLTHRLGQMLFLAASIGFFAALTGVALSRHILSVYGVPLSTAGITVVVVAAIYLCSLLPRAMAKSAA